MKVPAHVEPLRQRMVMEPPPYRHSCGETVGRFLAALRDQKKIWGRRASGLGIVAPPLDYSEADGRPAEEWVEVGPAGTVTAVARVRRPIEGLHPSSEPFAFILVRLDGADTAMVHIVTERIDEVRIGSRVEAVWADDGQRTGTIRDIARFRLV